MSSQQARDWATECLFSTLYALLSLLFTWPLATHLSSSVIGPFRGDNLEYVWKLWWVRHALLDLKVSPWLVPQAYWPYGYQLAWGEITPLHTVLMLPVNVLLGEILTYNLAILLSTWLSGWLTYLWLKHLTADRGASFVGGLIFAFCSYRMARIAGHLPLVSTQGLPLVLWGIERLWKRRVWSEGLIIGIGIAISSLSSWYYAFALALLVPVYWLARARPWREWGKGAWFWPAVALSGVITFGAVAPFVVLYVGVLRSGVARVPLGEADFWSASVLGYLLPNPRHPLWGPVERRVLLGGEGVVPYEFLISPGYVASALALFGWRRSAHSARPAVALWTLIALVLSLGPSLHLLPGVPARLSLPPGWASGVTDALTWIGRRSLAQEAFSLNVGHRVVVPLPALLVRWFVVAGSGVRSWGRFSLFAQLGIAALAALGLARLERGRRRFKVLAIVAAALLVLLESYTGPQSLVKAEPRAVDQWLADQPEDFAVVQMPLEAALSGPQMFYSRFHGKNVISGYGTYFPILFERRYPELAEFPSDASLELLARWPVRYVLVDRMDLQHDQALADSIASQPRLEWVTTIGDVDVYDIPRQP